MNETPPMPPPPIMGGPPVPTPEERNLAMLCHLLGIIASYTIGLGFVGPLILWQMKKHESPFVDFHGKEALNFQLSVMLYIFALGAVTFVTMFIFIGFFLIPVVVVAAVLALVAEIMACISASRGEWSRYPACIRFIP